MAPRKVRLVADLIRGLDTREAINQLGFMAKKSAGPILKLLNSAMANAENNFELKKDNLYIKEIKVDEGPMLHRWHAKAFGRTAPIRKKTSHLSLILEEHSPKEEAGKLRKVNKDLGAPILVKSRAEFQKGTKEEGKKLEKGEGAVVKKSPKPQKGFLRKTFMRKSFGE